MSHDEGDANNLLQLVNGGLSDEADNSFFHGRSNLGSKELVYNKSMAMFPMTPKTGDLRPHRSMRDLDAPGDTTM